jgi:hypothetical protein
LKYPWMTWEAHLNYEATVKLKEPQFRWENFYPS